MVADIALADRSEQRVGDCVEGDVGVAVAAESALVRDSDAAQPQAVARSEGVDVEAQAGAAGQPRREPPLGLVEIALPGQLGEGFVAGDQRDGESGGPGYGRVVVGPRAQGGGRANRFERRPGVWTDASRGRSSRRASRPPRRLSATGSTRTAAVMGASAPSSRSITGAGRSRAASWMLTRPASIASARGPRDCASVPQ